MTVDLAQYQRDRIRRLEQRVTSLERYRDQLERAYALACILIAIPKGQDPGDLAGVIHEAAEAEARTRTRTDDLPQLLRETGACLTHTSVAA